MLAEVKRGEEARAIAEETESAPRAHGNPWFIAYALWGYGRAFMETDPGRALDALRQGLVYARENRLPLFEANIARHAAGLEAVHGELDLALVLFDTAIDSFHRSGNCGDLAPTLAYLAVFFDRFQRPEIAATIYGTGTHRGTWNQAHNRHALVDHLPTALGETTYEECVATGAAMQPAEAVEYARQQIRLARRQLADPP